MRHSLKCSAQLNILSRYSTRHKPSNPTSFHRPILNIFSIAHIATILNILSELQNFTFILWRFTAATDTHTHSYTPHTLTHTHHIQLNTHSHTPHTITSHTHSHTHTAYTLNIHTYTDTHTHTAHNHTETHTHTQSHTPHTLTHTHTTYI